MESNAVMTLMIIFSFLFANLAFFSQFGKKKAPDKKNYPSAGEPVKKGF